MAGEFEWNGERLAYFDHPYNHTALNMRRVEIPIAWWYLAQRADEATLLEVGNVLGHYMTRTWPCVDLHERGAFNADVMAWQPVKRVDLLVCLSTIEHIGFGRYAGTSKSLDPVKILAHLRSFLTPTGRGVVTAPCSYNPFLDAAVREGRLARGVDQMWFMRVTSSREWVECAMGEAMAMSPVECAGRWSGGLMIFELRG